MIPSIRRDLKPATSPYVKHPMLLKYPDKFFNFYRMSLSSLHEVFMKLETSIAVKYRSCDMGLNLMPARVDRSGNETLIDAFVEIFSHSSLAKKNSPRHHSPQLRRCIGWKNFPKARGIPRAFT